MRTPDDSDDLVCETSPCRSPRNSGQPARVAAGWPPHMLRADRRAYTLIEMLIVCAMLAAIAGLSWPAMRGVLGKGRLRHAADEVQHALRKARTTAVRSGTAMIFQYEPGGRHYRVETWEAVMREARGSRGPVDLASPTAEELEPTNRLAIRDADPSVLYSRITLLIAAELPEGVRFAEETVNSNESVEAFADESLAALEITEVESITPSMEKLVERQWSSPTVFQPNGRSENLELRIIDDRRYFIDLHLRGLTGIVTASGAKRVRPDQVIDAASLTGPEAPTTSRDAQVTVPRTPTGAPSFGQGGQP